jgi:restriction system protein
MVKILEVTALSLDEWLTLMRKPPEGKIFIRNMFPTDGHLSEWLKTAHDRPESDIKLLLRHFLVSTGSNLQDEFYAKSIIKRLQEEKISIESLGEYERRLVKFVLTKKRYPVWEGLGWILDLLPNKPRVALDVLDAFLSAYWSTLNDNYLSGLFDAQTIIRNRYIESAHTANLAERVLLGLDWRDLEWLCSALYDKMGFQVSVTPRGDDDGVDVFAKNLAMGKKDQVVIQAKKWSKTNPVGKAYVRELLGTIDLHRATKGVLVTTGRYERGAIEMSRVDARIELIDRETLLQLLNEHCGADWYLRVNRLLGNARNA